MRSVHIAICDDDEAVLKDLHQTIAQKWDNLHDIHMFSGGQALIDHYREKRMPFDIVLLDILMDAPDGIETARTLREKDARLIIIFLTSSKDFMLQGYAIHAYQYLLKGRDGIERKELCAALEEAIAQVYHDEETVVLRVGRTYERVLLRDILYVTVDNKHVVFHKTDSETVTVSGTLKEYATILTARDFVCIHAGCIVNMAHIQNVNTKSRALTLSNCAILNVARDRINSASDVFLTRYRGTML